jgi:hypothetical protein
MREQVAEDDPRLDEQPTFGKGPGSLVNTPPYNTMGGGSDELDRAPGNRFSDGREGTLWYYRELTSVYKQRGIGFLARNSIESFRS